MLFCVNTHMRVFVIIMQEINHSKLLLLYSLCQKYLPGFKNIFANSTQETIKTIICKWIRPFQLHTLSGM